MLISLDKKYLVIVGVIAAISAVAVAYLVVGTGTRISFDDAVLMLTDEGFEVWTCKMSFDEYAAMQREIAQQYNAVQKIEKLNWGKFHDQALLTPPPTGVIFEGDGRLWFDREPFNEGDELVLMIYYCTF